ncbi:hypothetical protein MsAg5_11990 [Methanosarcinaceae archaeon Ag5]|uniref:Ferrous iron transporter FeoA-like domain-containing protein n=1 Tax=Methanolapillus africanus TaxID=3028297 RepID=A0AAE4MIR7_9EURY|nr:hypothetical protein [Methanosarcinaceae archaeon Ag5]
MTHTLKEVKPGNTCQIVGIDGSNVLKNRLLCMGVTPGTCVEVVKTAPMGDPIELRVRNYNLSIRKTEASGIHVENIRKCTVPAAGADSAKTEVTGSVS